MTSSVPAETLGLLTRASAQLLSDAQGLEGAGWRAPSRLPGWSRGHVATHAARNADALARVVRGLINDAPIGMYDSEEARNADIENGSGRDGVELCRDLEESGLGLAQVFADLTAAERWDDVVTLRAGAEVPAHRLPLVRLAEVVLHHVDLDTGFELAEVDEVALHSLLGWTVRRMAPRVPTPVVLATQAREWRLGPADGDARRVNGNTAELLGWLTGRTDAVPEGAADVELPPY